MNSPFLDTVLPAPAPADDRYIWAKVTQVSPLRIQVDGDRTPLGITPDTLTNALAVDQRVYCQIINRRLVVLGASGGSGVVAATPHTLALRDSDGNTEVGTPNSANDAVPKVYADALGDIVANANTIARRSTGGTLAVGAASSASHAVQKTQMDTGLALKFARINVVVITTTGAGTYTKPANLLAAIVECQGGGAGAGGTSATGAGQVAGANGGGAGGYARKFYLAADLSATEAYTVGVGGAGTPSGTPTAASTAGGATTFKGMTCNGGSGSGTRGPGSGNWASNGGGAGGTSSGGDINISGTDGSGSWFSTGGTGIAGFGGLSFLGKPGWPMSFHSGSTWATGDINRGYGCGASGGGAGASQSAHSGEAGRQGVIIITEFLSA